MSSPPDNPISFFAQTNYRNDRRVFGIRKADRRSHMYVIGKTGTGKTTLLETLIREDLRLGNGFAFIDPHGDLVERLHASIPEDRKGETVYFNVPDTSSPLAFNPLERVAPERRPLAASALLEAFKKIWADSWGPRLEHILRNALLALLDQHEATLQDVLELLSNPSYRQGAALRVANSQVRNFWLREYEGYPARFRAEAIAPLQNKVGAFLANPLLSRILTRPRSDFDLREMMDGGKILLVNLAKGRIGEDAAALLGALLVSAMGWAALSRADEPEEQRKDFYLYLDEFQNYTTLSLANMLSELRKYRLSLVLAHQYLTQLDLPVRDAILGNAGTLIAFRVGAADAEVLEKEFRPPFTARDLVNLPNRHIYLRLMVDGVVSQPFSAETVKNFL